MKDKKAIRQSKNLIKKYNPSNAAIEELFFSKNTKTAIKVAEARGVIILALTLNNIEFQEYKPKEVKSVFSEKRLIFFMCLQLLSGNRPDKSIFKDRVPFQFEGGFDWTEFREELLIESVTSFLPDWPILTLDIDFAELILTRSYEYPIGQIDLDVFTKPVHYIIDSIEWSNTPEGYDFWDMKWAYYKSNTDSETLKQPNKTENHEIKLQRKKSTVIRGTVPEGSITRGRKRKVTITVGYLSNSVCIGG